MESITYPDKRVITHSYNARGDLTETKDSQSGSLTYQRDDLGQTLKVTTPTGELGYTWNGNGQKLSQSINQLGSYQYSYDALGRIVAVEAIDGSLTQFGYDDVGNRTHIKRANGSESFYSYNDLNQLTKLEHKQGEKSLASFEYTLDNMGRKVEATEIIDGKTRTLNYEYDIEGRLLAEKITEAGKVSETRYTHDAQGNRLTKLENGEKTVYGYNKNDQLLTETISKTDGTSTTINYGWDANGNLLSKKSSDNTIDIQYGWNSANRLIKVTEGSKVTTYQYDGEDRRIGKVITNGTNTTETQYLIDSERNYDEIIVAKTRTTSGTQVGDWKEELYLYAPDGVGDLLLQSEVGTEHLYQDGKGSTRLVVNNNGTKTTFDYDSFGNPLASNANPESHIKHRYVGEVLDEETGFYYFRARHYDPKIGRFISRDSFEGVKTTPISLNPYLYAHSDPVNGVDPSGYMNLTELNVGLMNLSNMMTRGLSLYNKIEKVSDTLELILMISQVGHSLGSINVTDIIRENRGDRNFIDVLRNYDEGLSVLMQNKSQVFRSFTSGVPNQKIKDFFSRLSTSKGATALVIYGPTAYAYGIGLTPKSPIKIGRIKAKKHTVDIVLDLNRDKVDRKYQGGRFIGIGHAQAKHVNASTTKRQWFRMDWHDKHGDKYDWDDGSYHFHTNTGTGK